MTRISRRFFVIALSAMCTLQLCATLLNRNFWPVSSVNVFSEATRADVWMLKAVLIDAQGEEVVTDPGQTLPLEFFKARSIYRRVFVDGTPSEKHAFAERLLTRLRHGWRAFDETLPPANHFAAVRLRVEAWRLDPQHLDPDSGFQLKQRVIVYASTEIRR